MQKIVFIEMKFFSQFWYSLKEPHLVVLGHIYLNLLLMWLKEPAIGIVRIIGRLQSQGGYMYFMQHLSKVYTYMNIIYDNIWRSCLIHLCLDTDGLYVTRCKKTTDKQINKQTKTTKNTKTDKQVSKENKIKTLWRTWSHPRELFAIAILQGVMRDEKFAFHFFHHKIME